MSMAVLKPDRSSKKAPGSRGAGDFLSLILHERMVGLPSGKLT